MLNRRRNTGPSLSVRFLVLARDGHSCVVCGSQDRLQLHHRLPRRMGGSSRPWINQPQNLLTVCAVDHLWIESRRAEALDMGWLLKEGDDPLDVPAHIVDPPGWWLVYLTADGCVLDPPSIEVTS